MDSQRDSRVCTEPVRLILSLLCIPFLIACGTFEVGIEHTAAPAHTPPTGTTVEGTHPAMLASSTPAFDIDGDQPTVIPAVTLTHQPPKPGMVAVNPSHQANGHSSSPAISADGRTIAFSSSADNLVPGDTQMHADIFVYDREAHTTELVSLGRDSTSANGSSGEPSISADGRWVVFGSIASNLASGDTNDLPDVFLHDRQTGRTSLVSMAVSGRSGNGISTEPSISADGRWIAFESSADDLVPEIDEHTGRNIADTNETNDIFVYDRLGRSIHRVNLSTDGEQSNRASSSSDISDDGRWVVFWSLADNLVPGAERGIYLHDRSTGATQWIADGHAPSISPDGRWIGFLLSSGSHVAVPDDGTYVALYEREMREITVIGGYSKEGIEGKPSKAVHFSANGQWLALRSVFSPPDSPLTGDGDGWGQQVFLRDQRTETFTLLSATPNGLPGNSISASPSLSADGRYIAFQSLADNLDPGDTNGYMDVFVYDRETGLVERISWAASSVDTSTWPIYTNNEYGLQLRYPPHFLVVRGESTDETMWAEWRVTVFDERYQQQPPPQTPGIWISAYPNPDGISPTDWLAHRATFAPFGTEVDLRPPVYYLWPDEPVQQISVAGHEGCSIVSNAMGLRIPAVLLTHEDWMLEIAYGDFGPEDLQPVFTAMLQTLELEPVPK